LNHFVRRIHKKTTNNVERIFQNSKCSVLNKFDPYFINATIKMSILIMFAMNIKRDPVNNTFRAFFGFMSTVNVNRINNK